jgi:hypothetical protein
MIGADVDPFVLHLSTVLTEKERKLISDRPKREGGQGPWGEARAVIGAGFPRFAGRERAASAEVRAATANERVADIAPSNGSRMISHTSRYLCYSPLRERGTSAAQLSTFAIRWRGGKID